MNVTFQSEPDESFRGHAAIGELANKGNRIAWALAVPLVVVAWTMMLWKAEDWILLTGIVWVTGFGMMIALWIEARWRFRKLIRADPLATMLFQVEINDEGVTCTYADVYVKAGWPAIRRVVETKEFYFFMTAFAAAQHLPKRVLGASEGSLRALIRARAPDRGANLLPDSRPQES